MIIKSLADQAREKLEIAKRHDAYKATFLDNHHGREVLEHLLKKFVDIDTFVLNAPDLTLIKQGERRAILSIAKFLKMDINQIKTELEIN
jgi:hypothetical protein